MRPLLILRALVLCCWSRFDCLNHWQAQNDIQAPLTDNTTLMMYCFVLGNSGCTEMSIRAV